jgi:hypothetical protein
MVNNIPTGTIWRYVVHDIYALHLTELRNKPKSAYYLYL